MNISTHHQWAVSIQGQVQITLLGIPPDLRADGLSPGLGDWIIKATKAIDKWSRASSLNLTWRAPLLSLSLGGFFSIPLPCMGFGLRADNA